MRKILAGIVAAGSFVFAAMAWMGLLETNNIILGLLWLVVGLFMLEKGVAK